MTAGYTLAVSAYLIASYFIFRAISSDSHAIVLTLDDLLNFAADMATAANQLQKAYDWNISQLSTLGNTVLTVTLGFISTCLVELYKESFKRPDLLYVMLVGFFMSMGLYVKSQLEIRKLKSEFVHLYSILALLKV